MDGASPEPDGLLARGKSILRTLVNLGQSRLELFFVELQEERIRLLEALLLVMVGGVCATLALACFSFTLVVIFWDTHRVLVLILLTLGYAAGAALSCWQLRNHLRRWQTFSATLDQLKKDCACFKPPS